MHQGEIRKKSEEETKNMHWSKNLLEEMHKKKKF